MGQLVVPKPDSYVLEWEGIQMCGADCFPALRRLLKGSPWVAQLVLDSDGAHVLATQVSNNGVVQWNMSEGDWLIKTPHGRYWFMSEGEFASQFDLPYGEVASHGETL